MWFKEEVCLAVSLIAKNHIYNYYQRTLQLMGCACEILYSLISVCMNVNSTIGIKTIAGIGNGSISHDIFYRIFVGVTEIVLCIRITLFLLSTSSIVVVLLEVL